MVFFGGALVLAPWIVVLAAIQQQSADGFHLRLTSLGMSVFVVVGLLTTAAVCRRQAPETVLLTSATATFLFIAAWFNTVTAKRGPFTEALSYDLLVKLPMIVLCLWLALRLARDRGEHRAVPGWIPAACVLAALVLTPWFITVLSFIQRTGELHNLTFFWVGVDAFELVGMVATGWLLLRGSPFVAVSAAITATLLFSDAWFNVVTTVDRAHLGALLMALIELPLAGYSLFIASGEVGSWPDRRQMRPVGGHRAGRRRAQTAQSIAGVSPDRTSGRLP